MIDTDYYKFLIKIIIVFYVVIPISKIISVKIDVVPDIDNDLKLVKYSSKINTVKEVNAFLTNKIPKDEWLRYNFTLTVRKYFPNNFPKKEIPLHNKYEVEKVYKSFFEMNNIPRALFDNDLLDESVCIQEGAFFNNLEKRGDYYVIDSLHMDKYKYKPGQLKPLMKAYFKFENEILKIDHIYYNNAIYYPKDTGFILAKRVMYNFLVLKTLLEVHLCIIHLKISGICAYSIRKFMSSKNKMKQFLWNFTVGVHGVNLNTGGIVGENPRGTMDYFMPFEGEGFVDYMNDSMKNDCSSFIFPKEQTYPCKISSESKKIYDIYKKYIKRVLDKLKRDEMDECIKVYEYIKDNIKEYKDKSMEEVFASYMYTASILHIISADVLQQMVQGYDCPASINKDGSVNKYVYLWAMITIIVVNAPQRKLFMKLPDTYDILVRNEYNNILDEFSNINFKSIDIFNVDASVQK